MNSFDKTGNNTGDNPEAIFFHYKKTPDQLEVLTPAKLNLFLEVCGKRPDGFHEICSVAVPINLYDRIVFQFHKSSHHNTPDNNQQDEVISLECLDGEGRFSSVLKADETNLVIRAIRLLVTQLKKRGRVPLLPSVQLYKRIPQEAGLGGGSSDAAATLWALNQYWNGGFSCQELQQWGAELGSDVPLFLEFGPVLCQGRGEILHSLHSFPEMFFVLLKPSFGLSTKNVYDYIDRLPFYSPQEPKNLIEALRQRSGLFPQDPKDLKDLKVQMPPKKLPFFNRMEEAAFQLRPELKEMLVLYSNGQANQGNMSGSGTTLFYHCPDLSSAEQTAFLLQEKNCGTVFIVKTIEANRALSPQEN